MAETGTIILDSHDEQVRLASMLCRDPRGGAAHERRCGPDLFALEAEIAALLAAGPGYMACITGPSRTADIELVLTLGAHGPRQLHVLLLEDAL